VGNALAAVCLLSERSLELTPDLILSSPGIASQVVCTVLAVAAVGVMLGGLSGPSAIILGGSLAMSTTAVAVQARAGHRRRCCRLQPQRRFRGI
jgi:Kef-type K+ transport system membrane component KefB